jgi:poly(3-hydroxyalkanoate) synthetase
MKKTFQELHDETLISEAGGEMCSVPLEKLKSKAMRATHKKLCVDPKHWSTTDKKSKKSMWSKAAQRAASSGGHKLHNSVEEGYQEISNLVDITQEVMLKMIKAMKKDDFRAVTKLYKELGNIIK